MARAREMVVVLNSKTFVKRRSARLAHCTEKSQSGFVTKNPRRGGNTGSVDDTKRCLPLDLYRAIFQQVKYRKVMLRISDK